MHAQRSWGVLSGEGAYVFGSPHRDLGPNFTGLGNRLDFTPAHQVDLQTGMGPAGAEIGAAAELASDGRPTGRDTSGTHPTAPAGPRAKAIGHKNAKAAPCAIRGRLRGAFSDQRPKMGDEHNTRKPK